MHTQSIEGFWSILKKKLRSKGTNYKNIEGYFGEFLYRKMINNNVFENMIINIKNIY